jgi:hypothetical protein
MHLIELPQFGRADVVHDLSSKGLTIGVHSHGCPMHSLKAAQLGRQRSVMNGIRFAGTPAANARRSPLSPKWRV